MQVPGDLEMLVEERMQLTIDMCEIICRRTAIDREIDEALERCEPSEEAQEELAKQLFSRARWKLRSELLHVAARLDDVA